MTSELPEVFLVYFLIFLKGSMRFRLYCFFIASFFGLLSLSAKSEIVIPRICTAKFPAMYEAAVDAVKYFDEITARKERLKAQGIVRREFSCAGIGIHDEKSQLHGTPLYFFDASNRKLISICGFGSYISIADTDPNKCGEICPPMEWRNNDCDTKYIEFQKSSN